MPMTQADDVELYHEVHGADGPPLLLIAGLGGDHGAWNGCLDGLSGFRILLLDNRGAGRSTRASGPYSTAQMATDTAHVMDAAGMPAAHVAGLSMGGAIAQELALAEPGRILSLTLVSTWAACDGLLYRLMRSWADTAESCGMGLLWEQLLLWSFSPGLFDEGGERLEAMLAGAPSDPADVGCFVAQARACIEHDARERLHLIGAPTQVLVGDLDIYTPERYARRICDLVPGSELVLLPGRAHAFPIEEPDAFTAQLRRFVERVAAADTGGTPDD